jgi:hypothetical protein
MCHLLFFPIFVNVIYLDYICNAFFDSIFASVMSTPLVKAFPFNQLTIFMFVLQTQSISSP